MYKSFVFMLAFVYVFGEEIQNNTRNSTENENQNEDISPCSVNNPCKSNEFCYSSLSKIKCWKRCFKPNYEVVGDRECVDVDECKFEPSVCPYTHRCVNKIGSYTCEREGCYKGLKLVDGYCEDINECEETPGICGDGGVCFNYYGDYFCKCNRGYVRDLSTRACVDRDECQSKVCTFECLNTIGSYKCMCPDGYERRDRYCYDINECANSPCGIDQVCFNTFGSYQCLPTSCPSNHFYKVSYRHCLKRSCSSYDELCLADPVVSYKWQAKRMYMRVHPENFRFTYRLTGFSDDVDIDFYFDSGNEYPIFYLNKQNGNEVMVMNVQEIIGPKSFTLRLHGDVLKHGRLMSRYVYVLYIFVGPYDF